MTGARTGRSVPIASLTTKVPVGRSVDQIRALVERFGASEFGIQYDPATGHPVAVSFKVRDPHLGGAFLPVALRAPFSVVLKQLLDARAFQPSTSERQRITEHAERVAWRNLHDFVRASLIAVQTGIMSLGEAFMASLVVTLPTGEAKRLGELAAEGALLHAQAGGQLMLGPGRP